MKSYSRYVLCVCMFGILTLIAITGWVHHPVIYVLMGAYAVLGCVFAIEAVKEEREMTIEKEDSE